MDFTVLCEDFLQNLADEIEKIDINSNLEIDYLDGVLKISIIKIKKTFVINRNNGNQKIWYSSPFSGADYFSFDILARKWQNIKNLELRDKLLNELKIYLN